MVYKITLVNNDGTKEKIETDSPNLYELMRWVDKCEIKSFTIELS